MSNLEFLKTLLDWKIDESKVLNVYGHTVKAVRTSQNYMQENGSTKRVSHIECEIINYETNRFLSIKECADGSKITSIGQAINQAKITLAYLLKYKNNV